MKGLSKGRYDETFAGEDDKLHDKVNYLIKTSVFSLIGNYLRTSNNYRQLIFNINAVVLIDTDNLLRFTKLVKCIPEF